MLQTHYLRIRSMVVLICIFCLCTGCAPTHPQTETIGIRSRSERIQKFEEVQNIILCCISRSRDTESDNLCMEDSESVKDMLRFLKNEVELGNAGAQLFLGMMYQEGLCVDNDSSLGTNLVQVSAINGHPLAQNFLGSLYSRGEYVKQDFTKAFYWYQKAAENGEASGMVQLANMYLKGEGTKVDYKMALVWFKKAAGLEVPEAFYGVGYVYHNGLGVSKNIPKAIHWYNLAADLRYLKASNTLVSLYDDINLIKKDATRAFKLIKQSAWNGNKDSQYKIAYLYQEGIGVKQNIKEALFWYSRAAVQGKFESLTAIKSLYELGVAPPQEEIIKDNVKISSSAAVEVSRNGKLISYSDGTVVDVASGLMWADKDSERVMDWMDAIEYCYSYKGGRYTDWRMPTKTELELLADKISQGPILETAEVPIRVHPNVWVSDIDKDNANVFSFEVGHIQKQHPKEKSNIGALPVRSLK